ncbi:succinate dehydrogenase assembly factor 2 [Roseospirillum parvum]|uniref:FAD assembly factor SdhE n=1 Tax=Roseospirillum parvum TaxID=83401 RepID=A0A1G7XW90_9PROT|nr:succinate dehydrogenase assembly factor 2 [Roseospirillum parvum]SDG88421.1 antitoxin CptB [Roseospirillum parvum]
MPDADPDTRRRRLRYRALHRGSREADLLIGGFVTAHLDSLGAAELDTLETLLDELDADILDWVLGHRSPPAHLDTPLFARLKAHRVTR